MSDPSSSLNNLPGAGPARGSAATVSGAGMDGEIYIRPDGKKVRRVVKRVARPKSVVGSSITSPSAAMALSSGNNSTATTTTTSSTADDTPPTATTAPASTPPTTASTRPKTLGGFLDLVSGGKKNKPMGSKSVAGDFAKPKTGLFSTQSLAPKPSAAAAATDNEEYEIYVRPDGKKVRRVKRTIVKSRSGRDLSAMQDALTTSSPSEPASAQADTLDSLLSNVGAQEPAVKKKTSAATVTGAPMSQSAGAAGIGEIYINAQGKKVRRVIKRPPGPQKTLSASGLADMQQAVSSTTSAVQPAAASATTTAAGGAATPEYEVYRRADGKLVRRLKKPGAPSAGGLDNMLSSATPNAKTGAATVGGERVLGPGQEIREEVEIYIRPDGKKVRRVKKVIVKKKDASASVVPDEAAKATPLPPPPPPPAPPTMTTKAELDALLEASASKPPPRTGAASVAVVPSSGEIYINAEGKKVRRVKRTSGISPVKTGSADLSSMLGSASKPAGGIAAATVSGDHPSKDKHATAEADGEIYIRADGKKVRRVKKTRAAAAVGLVTDKAQLTQMLEKPTAAGAKVGAATVAGDQVTQRVDDGEIIIRADGKKVLRRKKVPAAQEQDGTEVYRRADGKLVRRVKRLVSVTDGGTSALDQKLGVDTDNRPRVTGAATVGGDVYASERSSIHSSPTTLPEAKTALHDLENGGATTASADENDSKAPISVQQTPDPPQHVKQETATAATPSPFVLSASRSPATPSWMTKRNSVKETLPASAPESSSEPAKNTSESFTVRRPSAFLSTKDVDEAPQKPVLAQVSAPPEEAPRNDAPSIESSAESGGLSEDEDALANFYRKKLKLGMPLDAVRHKMLQDGVADAVIVAVCGSSDEPSSATAPAPAPAAEPIVSSAESGLNEDEDALANFYRKKIKMGMPLDAVRHKMLQDGVAEAVIAAVCGSSDELSAESAAPSVPAATSEPTASSGLTEDEDALANFYRKKIKMGMPLDAVRHKMLQDGVADAVIAAVCGSSEEPSAAAAAPSVPTPAPKPTASSGLTEDEDALANFYRKKIKMGMPPDAVMHKMLQDGVAEAVIAAVCGSTDSTPTIPAPTSSDPIASDARVSSTPAATPVSEPAPTSVAYVVVVSDDPNLKLDKSPPVSSGSLANLPKGPKQRIASDERSLFSVLPTDKFEVKVSSGDSNSGGSEAATKYMTLDELSKLSGQSKDELEAMVVQRRENAEEPPKFVIQPQDVQPGEVLYPVSMMKKRDSTASSPAPAGSQAVNIPEGVSVPSMKPGEHLASIREDQEVVSSTLATAARAIAPLGDDITALLEKLQMGEMGELMKKLQEAEKRQKKLEKQLAGAGIQIAEDIDYFEALDKVGQIAKRMNEIGGSDVVHEDKEEQNRLREEYFKLEQEMERYNTALMISEEYQAEQTRREKEWEAVNEPKNLEALRQIRRHMPVNIRSMSEAELTGNPSPNGKFLPVAIAKKFKRTNVLQILRINPDDIERMHSATLENMRVTGLTLTERRALYAHLRVLGPRWEKNKAEKMSERKWTWYQMMKNNFKENLAPYDRHIEQYGPPDNHNGCPLLGKQCPIKADLMPDYRGDYGWTDKDEYEISNVTKADADDPGAKAMAEARELAREKKANERADLLKKHYKGKLLQVSKANGSCESMDEAMDKMEFALIRWIEFKIDKGGPDQSDADKTKEIANFTETINEIKLMVLDFAQRSGMQTSGKKQAGGDKPDIRSSVEASLSEEVIEMSQQFFKFITMRMKALAIYDTRISKTIELLEGMFSELHEKNLAVLANLQTKRSDRSRKLRTIVDIEKEVEEKRKNAAASEEEGAGDSGSPPPAGMPAGMPGRGGLLDGIKGRGGGGRGGLLDGIKGRGRGGGGPPGRGGLLDAISGRGRGGGPPGRGGFLDAIKGRGGGGGDGGGRGGLMAAIAARGGGG